MIKTAFYIATGAATFLLGLVTVAALMFVSISEPPAASAERIVLPEAPEQPQYYNFFSEPNYSASSNQEVPEEQEPAPCAHRILEPLWEILMKQKDFRENIAIGNGGTYCGDIFEIAFIDVNGDREKEVFLRGRIPALCGAVGNCAFWILQKRGSKYRIILESSDYIDRNEMGEQLLRTQTRGYTDLLLKGHFSAGETSFSYYKFNGRRYVEARCLYEVPNYATEDDNDWHFITCKQFYEGLGL